MFLECKSYDARKNFLLWERVVLFSHLLRHESVQVKLNVIVKLCMTALPLNLLEVNGEPVCKSDWQLLGGKTVIIYLMCVGFLFSLKVYLIIEVWSYQG